MSCCHDCNIRFSQLKRPISHNTWTEKYIGSISSDSDSETESKTCNGCEKSFCAACAPEEPLDPTIRRCTKCRMLYNKQYNREDLNIFTVKELKAFLVKQNVPVNRCTEKNDFIELILRMNSRVFQAEQEVIRINLRRLQEQRCRNKSPPPRDKPNQQKQDTQAPCHNATTFNPSQYRNIPEKVPTNASTSSQSEPRNSPQKHLYSSYVPQTKSTVLKEDQKFYPVAPCSSFEMHPKPSCSADVHPEKPSCSAEVHQKKPSCSWEVHLEKPSTSAEVHSENPINQTLAANPKLIFRYTKLKYVPTLENKSKQPKQILKDNQQKVQLTEDVPAEKAPGIDTPGNDQNDEAFHLDDQFSNETVQALLDNLDKPQPSYQPFYFAQQICRAKVLKENIQFSLKYYHDGKTLDWFNNFEFVVYTANLDSLQSQTIARVLDPEARVFSETFYSMSKKEKKAKVRRRVGKYCLTDSVKAYHRELKQRAKHEPRTLFVVVADEAHWGITRKVMDESGQGEGINQEDLATKNAHDTLINEWNYMDYPNVFVLQVSATPWNLLTTASRLSSLEVANYKNDMVAIREETYRRKLGADRVDAAKSEWIQLKSTSLGVSRSLHRVEWTDGLQDELRSGIAALIQIPCSNGGIKWLTVIEDGYNHAKVLQVVSTSDRSSAIPFTIEMGKASETVTVTMMYSNTLYELAVHENQVAFYQQHLINSKHGKSTNYYPKFHYIAKYGEDIFQLDSSHHRRPVNHDGGLNTNQYLTLGRPPIESDQYFPLVEIRSAFILYNYKDKSILKDIPEDKVPKKYLSLNTYYNSMRFTERSRQLLRADSFFQEMCESATSSSKSGSKGKSSGDAKSSGDEKSSGSGSRGVNLSSDSVLTADYCLMVVLTPLISRLSLAPGVKTIKQFLDHDPDKESILTTESANVPKDFLTEKCKLFTGLTEMLDKYHRGKQNHTISKVAFEYVVNYYSENALNILKEDLLNLNPKKHKEVTLEESFVKVLIFGTSIHIKECINKIDAMMENAEMIEIFSKVFMHIKENFTTIVSEIICNCETFKIVHDMMCDLSPGKYNKGNKKRFGKMKIIRASTKTEGAILYASLCTARKVVQRSFPYYFEVFRHYGSYDKFTYDDMDNSTAERSRMDKIMHSVRRNLQTDNCQYTGSKNLNSCKKNCIEYKALSEVDLKCKNCNHIHKKLTEYKDLNGLPCILILVENGRLGDTFPDCLDVMDLRLRGNKPGNIPAYTSLAQELGRLCRHVVKTEETEKAFPYALIGTALEKKLRKSLKKWASIYGYAVETGLVDAYIRLESRQTKEGRVIEKLNPSDKNFDFIQSEHEGRKRSPDPNRFLLKAEPQIGKTGVYLHLLKDLSAFYKDKQNGECSDAAEEDFSDSSDSEAEEKDDGKMSVDLDFPASEWSYPHWEYMKNLKDGVPVEVQQSKYDNIYGKYRYGIAPEMLLAERIKKKDRPTKLKARLNVCHENKIVQSDVRFNSLTHIHKSECRDCRKPIPAAVNTVNLKGLEFKVSIPLSADFNGARSKFFPRCHTLPHNKEITMKGLQLKTWIFTATHKRSRRANLNLYHTMVRENPGNGVTCVGYFHILVVRENQFLAYSKEWQHSHIIIAMPLQMVYGENTADTGGIGYARLFVQRLANALEFNYIIMLDDNIPVVYEAQEERKGDKTVMTKSGGLVLKQVPLYKVLKHLESLMDTSAKPPEVSYRPYIPKPTSKIETYTGPVTNYGALGIHKCRPGSRKVVNPFKRTHVCSLVMLNTAVLRDKKIEYHPWIVFEDLNLNNDLDNKGSYVTKFYRFQMRKRNLRDWTADMYRWTDETILDKVDRLCDHNDAANIAMPWVKYQAHPKRFSLVDTSKDGMPDENYFDRDLTSHPLLESLIHLNPGNEHFVAFVSKGEMKDKQEVMMDNIKSYFSDTTGIGGYLKHIIYIPTKLCYQLGLITLFDIRKSLISTCFVESALHFTVTTHNVNEYSVPFVLVYVEGKILNPVDAQCTPNMRDQPPVPQVKKTEVSRANKPELDSIGDNRVASPTTGPSGDNRVPSPTPGPSGDNGVPSPTPGPSGVPVIRMKRKSPRTANDEESITPNKKTATTKVKKNIEGGKVETYTLGPSKGTETPGKMKNLDIGRGPSTVHTPTRGPSKSPVSPDKMKNVDIRNFFTKAAPSERQIITNKKTEATAVNKDKRKMQHDSDDIEEESLPKIPKVEVEDEKSDKNKTKMPETAWTKTKDGKYQCTATDCQLKIYKSYSSLQRHWKEVHSESKMFFLCPIENSHKFKRLYELQKHLKNVHHCDESTIELLCKGKPSNKDNELNNTPGAKKEPMKKDIAVLPSVFQKRKHNVKSTGLESVINLGEKPLVKDSLFNEIKNVDEIKNVEDKNVEMETSTLVTKGKGKKSKPVGAEDTTEAKSINKLPNIEADVKDKGSTNTGQVHRRKSVKAEDSAEVAGNKVGNETDKHPSQEVKGSVNSRTVNLETENSSGAKPVQKVQPQVDTASGVSKTVTPSTSDLTDIEKRETLLLQISNAVRMSKFWLNEERKFRNELAEFDKKKMKKDFEKLLSKEKDKE